MFRSWRKPAFDTMDLVVWTVTALHIWWGVAILISSTTLAPPTRGLAGHGPMEFWAIAMIAVAIPTILAMLRFDYGLTRVALLLPQQFLVLVGLFFQHLRWSDLGNSPIDSATAMPAILMLGIAHTYVIWKSLDTRLPKEIQKVLRENGIHQ